MLNLKGNPLAVLDAGWTDGLAFPMSLLMSTEVDGAPVSHCASVNSTFQLSCSCVHGTFSADGTYCSAESCLRARLALPAYAVNYTCPDVVAAGSTCHLRCQPGHTSSSSVREAQCLGALWGPRLPDCANCAPGYTQSTTGARCVPVIGR